MDLPGLNVGRAVFLIEALESSFSCLSRLLEAIQIFWLIASFLFKVSCDELSPHITHSALPFCLLPLLRTL